jgi:hypothetical protein
VLLCHGLNKAFLVPDSCRATEGNGNSISGDITDDTVEKRLEQHLFQLFLDNLAVVLDFMILQDIHNICTFSLNIKLICTHCESSLFCLFLKLIQLNYIFSDDVHILYIYFVMINKTTNICFGIPGVSI